MRRQGAKSSRRDGSYACQVYGSTPYVSRRLVLEGLNAAPHARDTPMANVSVRRPRRADDSGRSPTNTVSSRAQSSGDNGGGQGPSESKGPRSSIALGGFGDVVVQLVCRRDSSRRRSQLVPWRAWLPSKRECPPSRHGRVLKRRSCSSFGKDGGRGDGGRGTGDG